MLRALCFAFLASCHAQTVQVDGSGTTHLGDSLREVNMPRNPSKFFWKIMETMEAAASEREVLHAASTAPGPLYPICSSARVLMSKKMVGTA